MDLTQAVIESSVDGILAFDRECRYTLWNPVMERISGVRREEVLGRRAFDVFPFLKETGEDACFLEALLLSLWGREVRVAHGGPAAIEMASGFAPEVVLLDVGLPKMDGYEVLRRMRALPARAGSVVAALTGYAREQDRALSRAAGFDRHLTKPVDPAEIQQVLERLTPLLP